MKIIRRSENTEQSRTITWVFTVERARQGLAKKLGHLFAMHLMNLNSINQWLFCCLGTLGFDFSVIVNITRGRPTSPWMYRDQVKKRNRSLKTSKCTRAPVYVKDFVLTSSFYKPKKKWHPINPLKFKFWLIQDSHNDGYFINWPTHYKSTSQVKNVDLKFGFLAKLASQYLILPRSSPLMPSMGT